MSELRRDLRKDFHDFDFRHIYAEESLNTFIATQIKVLREQREMTQTGLAKATGMAQPRIAVLEDINYSNWSINTLKRLARGLDVRLVVRFESFSSLIPELENFTRQSLERPSFGEDSWFHTNDGQINASVLNAIAPAPAQGPASRIPPMGARILCISDWHSQSGGAANAAASAASGQ